MRENLHRFFRAARGAGVQALAGRKHRRDAGGLQGRLCRPHHPARHASADARQERRTRRRRSAIVSTCSSISRSRSRRPKTARRDEQDQSDPAPHPIQPGDASGGDEQAEGLGQLAQMLLAQDRNQISAAIANAASAASLSDIRYFTQRGIFSGRILDRMGIERLRDDLDNLDRDQPGAGGTADRRAGRAARHGARDRLAGAAAVRARGSRKPAQRNPAQRAAVADRAAAGRADAALIRQIARRLRERYSKPRKRQRRGHLDVRRTIRRNAAWGGVPFLTAWKRRHRDKPKIVALCDVSGSVARVSDFFLLLIHSLHEVVDDVRSFAFSGHLIEVSDILESKSPEEAMAEIMSKVGFGSSDYGNSFVDFEHGWMSAITPQTTVIVLGDARSNNLDPRADILRRIAERSKRLVWLNPEGRMAWGWGDSEMPRYSTFCTVVRQCATAKQLERAVSDIVASYQ